MPSCMLRRFLTHPDRRCAATPHSREMSEPTAGVLPNFMPFGSWPLLVIQDRSGLMAPIERKAVRSKTSHNQRRNDQPFCYQLGHHLAFTKYDTAGEVPMIGLTTADSKKRHENISPLQLMAASAEAGFSRMFDFASNIKSVQEPECALEGWKMGRFRRTLEWR